MSSYDDVPQSFSAPIAGFMEFNVTGMSLELSSGSAMRVATGVASPVEIVPVYDLPNRIFVAAVLGMATEANITRALDALNAATHYPLDVLAIAFEGASIPAAAVRKRLSDRGISVVMGNSDLPAVEKARRYAQRLVSLADSSPLNALAA